MDSFISKCSLSAGPRGASDERETDRSVAFDLTMSVYRIQVVNITGHRDSEAIELAAKGVSTKTNASSSAS